MTSPAKPIDPREPHRTLHGPGWRRHRAEVVQDIDTVRSTVWADGRAPVDTTTRQSASMATI